MKTKQKLWLIAITVLLLTLLFALCASAEEPTSGSCGNQADPSHVQWSLNTETGVLTISGSGAMKDYDESTDESTNPTPWLAHKDNIRKIVIGQGVTKIGDYAFKGCVNLTEISLPERGFQYFGRYCFNGCTALTEVTLPSTVKDIRKRAFLGCSALKIMVLPASVEKVQNYAFAGCTSLTSLVFLGTPTILGTTNEPILSNNAKTILYCDPESSVATYANTKGFDTLPLTANGTCGTSATWAFDAETQTLTISGTGAMADYSNTYTADPWQAYESLIMHLVIEDGVTSVGEFAFGNISALESVSLPDSLTSIGKYAFRGCTSLEEITIPGGVEKINDSTFNECTSLKTVTLEEGVTTIAQRAFRNCTALTEIVIPSTVTTIGTNGNDASAFEGCTNLAKITFYGPNTKIYGTFPSQSITLYGFNDSQPQECAAESETDHVFFAFVTVNGICNSSITWTFDAETGKLTISGAGNMDDYSAYENEPWYIYRSHITDLTVSEGVTSIGNRAFGMLAIKTAELPSSLTSIGSYAFSTCSSLVEITIPGGVQQIKDSTFNGCTSLKTVLLSEGIITIAVRAFRNCSALTEITIPSTVTQIGGGNSTQSAFEGCEGLEKITFLGVKTEILSKAGSEANAVPSTATIYGYVGSNAQNYAIANDRKFVSFSTDGITTVFELTATYEADAAKAGQHLSVATFTRTDANGSVAVDLLYVESATGELYVMSTSGVFLPFHDEEGTAIALGTEETAIAIIYDDESGVARYYVNGVIPYVGEEATLAHLLPVHDANFASMTDTNDTFTTLEGVNVTDVYNANASATAEWAGYQVSDDSKSIRILAGLDMLYYGQVGFEIELYSADNLQGSVDSYATTVFSSIVADGETVTAASEGYRYLTAIRITDIYPNDFDNPYLIVKTYTSINGEKVYGAAKKITITYDSENEKNVYTIEDAPVEN